jgi:hypothetical protein
MKTGASRAASTAALDRIAMLGIEGRALEVDAAVALLKPITCLTWNAEK